MKNQAKEIKAFLLEKLKDHPKDIVAVAARHFSVSRTTVHRHLNRLIRDGKIIRTGVTKKATYFLKSSRDTELVFEIKPGLGEYEIWSEYFKDAFANLPKNVYEICEHGFSEIFNNALDHSEGTKVTVEIQHEEENIKIKIHDDGVGIFKKIAQALSLEDERESILQLSKGRFTTDPQNHSGEGIYFTSRAFDLFFISSHELCYLRNNLEEDWFFEARKEALNGTWVSLIISRDNKRVLHDIYAQYTILDEDDIPRFDKTHILVKLSKFEEERYVSRSQAKRLLLGIGKFRHVILDFKKVETVGQAFVDEVFRVFKLKHPEIHIEYINVNKEVKFMIERGLTRPDKQIPLPFIKLEPDNN